MNQREIETGIFKAAVTIERVQSWVDQEMAQLSKSIGEYFQIDTPKKRKFHQNEITHQRHRFGPFKYSKKKYLISCDVVFGQSNKIENRLQKPFLAWQIMSCSSNIQKIEDNDLYDYQDLPLSIKVQDQDDVTTYWNFKNNSQILFFDQSDGRLSWRIFYTHLSALEGIENDDNDLMELLFTIIEKLTKSRFHDPANEKSLLIPLKYDESTSQIEGIDKTETSIDP